MSSTRKKGLAAISLIAMGATMALVLEYVRQQRASKKTPSLLTLLEQRAEQDSSVVEGELPPRPPCLVRASDAIVKDRKARKPTYHTLDECKDALPSLLKSEIQIRQKMLRQIQDLPSLNSLFTDQERRKQEIKEALTSVLPTPLTDIVIGYAVNKPLRRLK